MFIDGGGLQQRMRTIDLDQKLTQSDSNAVIPDGIAREIQMKRIIAHFMGNISFDLTNLESIADKLENKHENGRNLPTTSQEPVVVNDYSLDPLSTNTMHYSGEFSHWNFSKMLERRLQSLGSNASAERAGSSKPFVRNAILMDRIKSFKKNDNGFFRATDLLSSGSCVSLAKQYFPPRPIADFLVKTFLEYAQTNYFYFDEDTFRSKLDFFYGSNDPLTVNDAGWVCTLLMTFAIGTQFAYMQTRPTSTSELGQIDIPDDHIGIELYRFSCKLIPDLITTASVETVQAFLLMGSYTLPIDTSGLAYTYYGLAIKMAVQNGMHRRFPGDSVDDKLLEVRNRLWWSAHSLESRISILHGRPVSVSPAETDTPMPNEFSGSRTSDYLSNLPNFSAAIILTKHLANASECIKSLRSCNKSEQQIHLRRLAAIRDKHTWWWSDLPTKVHCRDLNPSGPLFRANIHLEIYHITTIIYIGRPFIISPLSEAHNIASENNSSSEHHPSITKELSDESLNAALRGIELCQILQDSVGLARVSYTEFSACRISLLALIAHSLNQPTAKISTALTQGMAIIRQICAGLESAKSEVAVIEALERARQRLYSTHNTEESPLEPPTSVYDQFQEWAKLWRIDPLLENTAGSPHGMSPPVETQPNPSVPSFDGFFSSFPDELCEFTTIPGLNGEVSLDHDWLDNSHQTGDAWNADNSYGLEGSGH
ncbi:hypothetical protein VI817_001415 [Penicillium citrinum]|nr:hypothetical protein VI817_001415 [Penicillium citrinum]